MSDERPHHACDAGSAVAEVRTSNEILSVVSLLERHRDFSRDHGVHGLGAMDGKAYDDPQRVRAREIERVLSVLIGALS